MPIRPGFIGAIGSLCGNANVNIAAFHLGRAAQGGDAICLIELDEAVPASLMYAAQKLEQVQQAKALEF